MVNCEHPPGKSTEILNSSITRGYVGSLKFPFKMTLVCATVLSGGRIKRHGIPGQKYYSGFFESELRIEDNLISRPFTVIRGELLIRAPEPIRCSGIRVQLNATVNLKFNTKAYRNFSTTYRRAEGLLQGSSYSGMNDYILSPIREDILIDKEDFFQPFIPDPSRRGWSFNAYPFTLAFPQEPLPSPFKSQYGDLEYKIVAYMQRLPTDSYVDIGDHPLRFKGFRNLSQQPQILEPSQHESSFQNSMSLMTKSVTAVLSLEKRGFLPGDDLPFELTVDNPNCCVVRKFSINLVRLKIYNAYEAKKTKLDGLDIFENKDVSKTTEILYEGKLTVPSKNCVPTYTEKTVYSVLYLLHYQLTVADYPEPLKGQVEVIIGTTNDPVEGRGGELEQEEGDEITSRGLNRSDSTSSILSDTSIMTTISLPPAYSQLPSRAMSMVSLETLPPHYDDLESVDVL